MWVCVVILLLALLANSSFNLSKKTLLSQTKIQNLITESITTIHDIKTYALERTVFEKWKNTFSQYLNIRSSNGTLNSGISSLLVALQVLQSFFIFFMGSYYVIHNTMSFGELYYILTIAAMLAEPVFSSCAIYMALIRTSTVFQRIDDVMELDEESNLYLDNDLHYCIKGSIEFKNVSFRYSKFDPLILENVSFYIEAGKTIYLQGISGSGKSTIIKLILGLYKVSSGEILIDGIPITDFDINILRKSIAVVSQDGMLFNTSILDNIILSDNYDKKKFEEVIQETDLYSLINELPQKEYTNISENGIDFSKGQRQRILLARALYKESSLLILDEATNHLHKDSEESILQNILLKDKTKIIISHTSKMQGYDQILLLDRANIRTAIK